ncbi:acylneuraminate cytidylyltransferase family protein [Paenibacillus sp. HB172176]|uniref:acylneuraminate cytidylyltransferase family protein n=1 Tax=Paenibacillus sp. HB172176 TaxID=2493690 RepID=UPI001438F5A6|nr:acylneuraminate cytidylyltransferase family protein [Paenibacillus sp. HB172176]
MKIVGLVPIKLNSERLKNKNILPFENGEPLIHYIQKTLLQVKGIDESYVYCSDDVIKNYLIDGIAYKKRETYLDDSKTPFNEVLFKFADEVIADYYVLTHSTAPFIKSESIERGIQTILDGGYDSAVGVNRLYDFLWKDNAPLNYNLNDIPRTQDLPLIYAETCGLYIYSRELIINQRRRIGDNPYFVELSKIESIDINDKDDFIIANAIFNESRISIGGEYE